MGHNRFVKEVFIVKKIYEPAKMHHIELKNRLIRSATWEGIANPDGSEDRVSLDRKTRTYHVLHRTAQPGQGRYSYLIAR